MTDDNDPEQVRNLSDLNVATVRRENDYVDERMAELEAQVSDLEQEVATLEDEKEEIASEKEAAEELLADFREGQREEQLNRIKQANEAVAADDEVDLSTLEDASVDTLETVADMLESAAGSAGVSNTDRTPDLSNVEGDDSPDLEEMKAKVAEESGLGSMYKNLHADDESNDSPTVDDLVSAYEANNTDAGGAF